MGDLSGSQVAKSYHSSRVRLAGDGKKYHAPNGIFSQDQVAAVCPIQLNEQTI
jgi:hypothetical protein